MAPLYQFNQPERTRVSVHTVKEVVPPSEGEYIFPLFDVKQALDTSVWLNDYTPPSEREDEDYAEADLLKPDERPANAESPGPGEPPEGAG